MLAPWKKSYYKPRQSIKIRDITLLTRVHIVKAIIFPVVMYGCESWAIKKAECWGIEAFELWSWRWLLRAPWTSRRFNQAILKEINPEDIGRINDKAEAPIFWPTVTVYSLGKPLMLGKIEGRRRTGQQKMRWSTHWTWVWANSKR